MKFKSTLIVVFSKFHTVVLRITKGKLMGRLVGLDMLLLTTVGKKTGKKRYTPLLFKKVDSNFYCAGSFGGSDKAPQWYTNILSNPEVEILAEGELFAAKANILEGKAKANAWNCLINLYPNFQKYQDRTDRVIPVIRFEYRPIRD
ncbi:MAG: nitroreductase/quinone reductase family protein [Chloroflexota bacterium]|nr:nitroreductase/quinone reductase family protein [Chloroflexota bacterium]MED5450480.1 nitroreductase/quinone reductase family protein [Chloroflexota bacterium]